jgi:Spy/CpxP family protein refolding chaperone
LQKRIKPNALKRNRKTNQMKKTIIAVTASIGLALGTLAVYAQGPGAGHPGHGGHGFHGNPLEHLTKELNLTPQQQAQIGPIVDQAKPQIKAIHQEAMQKTKAVMDSTEAQIRPLLTAEQQQKLDAIKKAHEDMRNAMKEMHEARQQPVDAD